MLPGSKLLKAFAVCASLSACGSLGKIDTAEVAPPPPNKKAVTIDDIDGFGKPEASTYETANSLLYYMFMRERCVELPASDFTYVNDMWITDCSGIRPTDSGDFLIRHFLQKEYQKRMGTFQEPKSYPDKQAFRFVG